MNPRKWTLVTLALAAIVCLNPARAAEQGNWHVGIRDGYLRGIGEPDIWSAAKAIGVDQIELQVDKKLNVKDVFEADGSPYSIATPEDRAKLKARFKEKGVRICAFCAGHNYDQKRTDEQALEWLAQIAEAAKDLDVPVIMVPVPGGKGMTDEQFMERGKKFLGALVPISKRTGVPFALENLQLFWNRVEVLEPVLKSLPTDNIGLAHDVTNMYWYGHPIDKIYTMTQTIAPYVKHYCHAKNENFPADKKNVQRTPPGWGYGEYATSIRDGDIDFRRILDMYAKAGWRGTVTIEDDSLGKHDAEGKKKVLKDDVAFLREVIGELEKKYK